MRTRDLARLRIRRDDTVIVAGGEEEPIRAAIADGRLGAWLRRERESKDLAIYALMITDVLAKSTEMLVAGDVAAVARSFGVEATDSMIDLPGVMSRKKQVAPKLMTSL